MSKTVNVNRHYESDFGEDIGVAHKGMDSIN